MNGVETATIVPTSRAQTVKLEPANPSGSQYNVALGYLRAFLTLLVLAHHSVLAYHPYAPPPSAAFSAEPMLWRAFPIVDTQRWHGIDLLVGFNDIFFMSLMFLLSGLFVWPSLKRKGTGAFLRDRVLRLGVPFAIAATFLAPLAYYPAYRVTGADPSLAAFCRVWLSLGTWPSGPVWFIWMLLAFGCAAAGLFRFASRFGEAIGRLFSNRSRRPVALFGLLVLLSAVAYMPMAYWFDPGSWVAWGPFTVQISRLLHYALYFVAGIGLGAYGIDSGLLAPEGKLARRWPLWIAGAVLTFLLAIGVFIVTISLISRGAPALGWRTLGNFTFVLSCAASSFAFLALFVRFVRTGTRFFDSLSANGYGMYLMHYVFVSWLQWALLGAMLAGALKGSLVFVATVALSWAASAALRRIPAVARVL